MLVTGIFPELAPGKLMEEIKSQRQKKEFIVLDTHTHTKVYYGNKVLGIRRESEDIRKFNCLKAKQDAGRMMFILLTTWYQDA